MDQKISIIFCDKVSGHQKNVSMSQGQSLLEVLVEAQLPIDHSCGGMGTCGTCRIHMQISSVSLEKFSRNDIEQEIANERCFSLDERLACQVYFDDLLKFKQLMGLNSLQIEIRIEFDQSI